MMKTLQVSCPTFLENGYISDRYSAYGANLSPELLIEDIDPAAVSMAITLDDLDHPLFPHYNHWVAWNLPVLQVIPEGLPSGAIVDEPIHLHQGMAYGKHGYRGPKPPFHWCHQYVFTIYTLDTSLQLPPQAKKQDLLTAMKGHILQTATLTGKYQKQRKKNW